MTFREFMRENGYELQTTFWEDFSIADRFGLSAIRDTFNRAFEEWRGNYKYLTELTLVLNHKIWQYHEKIPEFAKLYNTLWEQAGQYAVETLKDDELSYYYEVTDKAKKQRGPALVGCSFVQIPFLSISTDSRL
mgnify:CR=1 FL=1